MTNWRYEFRKLQPINEKLKKRIEELETENKKMKELKCPPIESGDTCICPIEELESMLIKKDEQIAELEAENKSLTEFAEEAWTQSGYHGCFTDWLEQEAPKFKFEPS